jgi:hypothetical protein
LYARAAPLLSVAQLAALEAESAGQIREYQQFVADRRRYTADSATADDERLLRPPRAVPDELSLAVSVLINHNTAVVVSRTVGNGEVINVPSAEGLWIEVVPTLFADGTFEVEYSYYEEGPAGRRQLQREVAICELPNRDPTAPAHVAQGSTLVNGRTAYYAELSVWSRLGALPVK